MGNPSFVVQPGQGVFIDVPYEAIDKEVEVLLKWKKIKHKGRKRRRLEAFYNGRKVNISRRPLDNQDGNQ